MAGIGAFWKKIDAGPTRLELLPIRFRASHIGFAHLHARPLEMLDQGILARINREPCMPELEGEIAVGVVEAVQVLLDPTDLFQRRTLKEPVIDHEGGAQRPAHPVLRLFRPRTPIERQAAECATARELTIESPDAVRDRVRVHHRIVAQHADITALRAFEGQVGEVTPAPLPLERALAHLAIVLDDGQNVFLADQPFETTIARAALDHDDFGREFHLACADAGDRGFQEWQSLISCQHD